jgi:hypothetical protein
MRAYIVGFRYSSSEEGIKLIGLFIVILMVIMLFSINFSPLHQVRAKGQTLANKNTLESNVPKLFSSSAYNITMNYPTNWTFNNTTGIDLLKSVGRYSSQNVSSTLNTLNTLHILGYFVPANETVVNKTVAPTILTLSVKDNVGNLSLQKYISDVLNQQNISNTNYVNKTFNVTLGKVKGAAQLVYSKNDNLNRPTNTMNIVAMKNNKIYLIVFSSSPEAYMKYLPAVERMKNSFVIK